MKSVTVTVEQLLVGRVTLDVDVDEDGQPLDDLEALKREAVVAVECGDIRPEWDGASVRPLLAWYDDDPCRLQDAGARTPWCSVHDSPMAGGPGRAICYVAKEIAQKKRFEALARIRAGIHRLYPRNAEKEAWLNSPHTLLDGAKPADLAATDREPEVWAVIEQLESGAVV